jgi:hypothetical protein
MADSNQIDPDKLEILKAQNEVLKANNKLLETQLKYVQEGNSLSSDYVERLREITKIREKALKTEETSLDIAKKMQNALRNYNKDLESSKGIEEQIKKNKELLVKALKEQKDLSHSVAVADEDVGRIQNARITMAAILNRQREIELESAKSIESRDEDIIKKAKERLAGSKELLKTLTDHMSEEARIAFQLENQIKAMNVLIAADEKSLELAKQKEVKEKAISAVKRATGLNELSLTTLVLNAFNKLDAAQTDFQRQTGKTVEYTRAIAGTFDTGMISMSDYIKTASDLTRQLGSNAEAIFSPQTMAETSILVNAMGLAVDEANNLAILSRTARVEMDKQDDAIIASVDNFNKFNKTAFTGAQIMKDVAKTSAATTVSLGFNAEKIAKANLEARKLGVSLDQVDRTAESLLNFEQSISSELEAELLTGKSINLEQARLLALNNDLEGVAKELGKNQELLNSYVNGNRIQQESIAKAMGMNREEMGKMIMSQKTQLGLTDEQVEKASGLSKEDFRRLTLQNNINKSIEKMAEVLAMPLEMLARVVNFMNKFYGLWIVIGTIGVMGAVKGMQQLIQLTKMLTLENLKNAAAWIITNPLPALAGAAVAAGIIYGIKSMTAGDINSPAKGKTTVSTKEGGIFELSPNDDLIAAPGISDKLLNENPTNINPGIAKLATAKSSAAVMVNSNAGLESKFDEFIKKQDQSNEILRGIHRTQPKEFALSLETTKFGTALAQTAYQTK